MAQGFVYLVAVMDWYSRQVLAWRMSITMEANFCVEALREAIVRYGQPEIFNTDQGVRFTSAGFLEELEHRGIRVSMDGKERFLDDIFIERLWRSPKYEDVFIKAYGSVAEARQSIGGWLHFYNEERLHQALGYRTPRCSVRWRSPLACGQRLRFFEWLRRCPQASGHGVKKAVDSCITRHILR